MHKVLESKVFSYYISHAPPMDSEILGLVQEECLAKNVFILQE